MKRLSFLIAAILYLGFTSHAQNNVGINDDNSSPNASAMLDVYSSTKGMLVPRVALTLTTNTSPITSPVASLLVYNTATVGDVTPGYYYWNGSTQWVRLNSSTDPANNFNMVLKSANITLLKTETMVLASGDITLTLPTVTGADDGLEITVKNIGTYTDLVKVTAEAGKTIDANDTTFLTRWHSRTFIASSSNWILKEKETKQDNQLDVSASGSFTTIAEVVGFLNLHMSGPTVVVLGGGTYQIEATQTIDLPYPVTFEGSSYGETNINAAAGVSGNPLFTCVTECYFKMLIFNAVSNASGNDAIRLTGTEIYHEIKDCVFLGFNKGVVCTNNTDLWAFENDFEDCTGAGIEIAAGSAAGGRLRVSETDFVNCAKGINLLSGASEIVSVINATFYNTPAGSDIGINYVPATFTAFQSIFVTHNAWNNHGTYMSGFDYTRTDGRDANAFMLNNAGTENKNPHCKINVNNNTSNTSITNAGTFYKANWTNTSIYTCKWTISNNKITYQTDYLLDAMAIITGNLTVDDNNSRVTIAIVRNGVTTTRYGETDLRVTTANQPFQFSTVIYIPDMKKNDYLELYVTTSHDGDIVKFQDIQWFMNTQ